MNAHYNYQKAVDELIKLWQLYHKTYSSLVPLYRELSSKAKNENLCVKVKSIKEKDIKEFPNIPFLKLATEEEAEEYIFDLTPRQIEARTHQINDLISSHIWRNLIEYCKAARLKISGKDKPKIFVGRVTNSRRTDQKKQPENLE